MLRTASDLSGYSIAASDGHIGHVHDILFDDDTWLVRWIVVTTGEWLSGRKVLLPPSVLGHLNQERHEFRVQLDKAEVKESPDIDTDKSVSRRMETHLYDHYGWTPYWGSGFYMGGGGYIGGAMGAPYFASRDHAAKGAEDGSGADVHLRSVLAVTGYNIHAADGDIGHIQDFLVEDADWSVRYLVAATTNWWPGKKVLISPQSVREIDWAERRVDLKVDRQKVKDSPAYETPLLVDRAYSQRFNNYYAGAIS
jgi:sporulation protein YlmC with PRC-barrel domain